MGPKLKSTGILLGVFCLGVVTGIAWQVRTYRHWTPNRNPERRIARMKKELNLTPDQEKAVRDILEKAHQRAGKVQQDVVDHLKQIRRDSLSAIQKILTPEQRVQFDQMRARRRHRHSILRKVLGGPPSDPEKPDVK